ncbi:hypothetical protein D3C85_782560 [compost metagenome]
MHGRGFQRGFADGEEIAFPDQRNEVQPEAAGGRLHAHAGVGHAAGDVRGDGHVSELVGFVALDFADGHAGTLQHQAHQIAGAGADLAVDEAHIGPRQVRHAPDLLGIAGGDEQAGVAHGQVDQHVFVGVQPLRVTFHDGGFEVPQWHLETRQIALVALQRGQRLDRGAVAQFQPGLAVAHVLHQRFHRETVAGVQAQVRAGFRQQALQFFLQFRGHAVQGRHQPRLDAAVGPQQALREGRELRALTAVGDEKLRAEDGFEAAQHAPAVAVRQPAGTAGARDIARGVYGRQQRKHVLQRHGRQIVVSAQCPLRPQADTELICHLFLIEGDQVPR